MFYQPLKQKETIMCNCIFCKIISTPFSPDDASRNITGIISDILKPGLIHIDAADIRAIMDRRYVFVGVGYAEDTVNSNRAVAATECALAKLPLRYVDASGFIINFTGGNDMSISEIGDAAQKAYTLFGNGKDTNGIVGTIIDHSMKNRIEVTIIVAFNEEAISEEIKAQEWVEILHP